MGTLVLSPAFGGAFSRQPSPTPVASAHLRRSRATWGLFDAGGAPPRAPTSPRDRLEPEAATARSRERPQVARLRRRCADATGVGAEVAVLRPLSAIAAPAGVGSSK